MLEEVDIVSCSAALCAVLCVGFPCDVIDVEVHVPSLWTSPVIHP